MSDVKIPNMDINGKAFSERDQKLLGILLRPDGGSLEGINRAVATGVAARSYINDTTRLAKRLGGEVWTNGHGGTRRFGIKLPR
jgi:hypothetical protein